MPRLVVTRRAGESVQLDHPDWTEPIIVTILRDERDHIRLAFEAPADVRILRSELIEATPAKHEAESAN